MELPTGVNRKSAAAAIKCVFSSICKEKNRRCAVDKKIAVSKMRRLSQLLAKAMRGGK
jgi:hypothetical protein